jgi:hypothetical protein
MDNPESLRLAVRTTAWLERDGGERIAVRIAGELHAVIVWDHPESVEAANVASLQRAGLEPPAAYRLALHNTQSRFAPEEQVCTPLEPGSIGKLEGDFFESSRIVDVAAWEPVARQAGRLLVAVPDVHLVLYGDGAHPGCLDVMRQIAHRISHAGRVFPLSAQVLEWTHAGWTVAQ